MWSCGSLIRSLCWNSERNSLIILSGSVTSLPKLFMTECGMFIDLGAGVFFSLQNCCLDIGLCPTLLCIISLLNWGIFLSIFLSSIMSWEQRLSSFALQFLFNSFRVLINCLISLLCNLCRGTTLFFLKQACIK